LRSRILPLAVVFPFALACTCSGLSALPAGTATPPYVPPDCAGQAIATLPAATTIAQPTPALTADPALTKDRQLEVFEELAGLVPDLYVYPDLNGLDWPETAAAYRARIEAGLDTEAFYAEMGELILELGDEHSHFESPAEAAASDAELAGVIDYVGIGILMLPLLEEHRLTVLTVFPDSPAEHAGLKPHDSLLAVDGIPIVDDPPGSVEPVAHPERVRGPECSALVLTVQSPGGAPRDITLVRHAINTSLPVDARLVPTEDGSRIGYIFIPTFFDETIPGKVRRALEDFGELDGLILDNRMNGGGSNRVVEPILAHFTDGTLGGFVSRTGQRPLEVRADPVHNSLTVPLVILVGEDTVSFGEIFSGVLQDIGRAQVVGQTTLGNVELLRGHDLSDGSRVWLAEERFDSLNSGADWELTGIVPDLVAYAGWDTFTFETDPAVAAALQVLAH
jgi:C-terminal peptidase prc